MIYQLLMPLIEQSSYNNQPWYLFNGHFETMFPSLFRKIEGIDYQREQIDIFDGDFLDLDWAFQEKPNQSNQLVIVSHGLEGHSERHYSKGMVKAFFQQGWDGLAWNCRTCGGSMNRLPRMYHHGATEDLAAVIDHVLKNYAYETIVLVGFSMGGSLTLKYLGENSKTLDKRIKKGIAFSVPIDLPSGCAIIHEWQNTFYKKRFIRKIVKKIKLKAQQFPDQFDLEGIDKIDNFYELDTRYTAPLYGFKDAEDFYEKVSCHQFLPMIKVPTLVVNAQNDPLLSAACYPTDFLKNHPFVYFEMPKRGGHVGFLLPNEEQTWAEKRAIEFAEM